MAGTRRVSKQCATPAKAKQGAQKEKRKLASNQSNGEQAGCGSAKKLKPSTATAVIKDEPVDGSEPSTSTVVARRSQRSIVKIDYCDSKDELVDKKKIKKIKTIIASVDKNDSGLKNGKTDSKSTSKASKGKSDTKKKSVKEEKENKTKKSG